MSQQTALEWLLEQMLPEAGKVEWKETIEKAKEMEKQQINQACYDGYYTEEWLDYRQYFDKKFKK
jgi:hypothetical protein